MKHSNKLSVKIVVAVTIGFLVAGAGTKITYICAPIAGTAGCVSFEKAVMHPNDLLSNKQNSLIHFSEAFVVASLVSFAIFSGVSALHKKPD